MNTISLAHPSNRRARRTLARRAELINSNGLDLIDDFDAILVSTVVIVVVVGGSLWLTITGRTATGITVGWLGIATSVLVAGWRLFQSKWGVDRRYKRHLINRTIIEVPAGLIAMWDEVVAETPGFAEWSKYGHSRFAVLASLLSGAKHLLRPLFYECPCGNPASCESTEHFSAIQKTDAAASLASLMEVELAEHTTAFAAHRAAIDAVRANQLVLEG
ncbi:MAG TPA: hypothetical protein VJM32_01725 [Candidatus Saccharimonadales bacterium]|nr:hypothetical protein [Candidatus Saccharimonadales bacterium]